MSLSNSMYYLRRTIYLFYYMSSPNSMLTKRVKLYVGGLDPKTTKSKNYISLDISKFYNSHQIPF